MGSFSVGRKEVLQRYNHLSKELWDSVDSLFPVRITRSWYERMGDAHSPLALQVLPSDFELTTASSLSQDPVGEHSKKPVPWVIQKHDDRALLLLTKRCHLYCRYCFRRAHGEVLDPTKEELNNAISWLNTQELEEVILTGGDPLAARPKVLFETLEQLKAPVLRIHTRAPITAPSRIRSELIKKLAAFQNLWVIVHCNHPEELSTPVREVLGECVKSGIPVLNQSVLLKGVNDNSSVLIKLMRELVRIRVYPYYLHHTDPVVGAGHFQVSISEGLKIYAEMKNHLSGMSLPRYVIDLPDGAGKIDVEQFARMKRDTDI